jgi:hypothetical protein
VQSVPGCLGDPLERRDRWTATPLLESSDGRLRRPGPFSQLTLGEAGVAPSLFHEMAYRAYIHDDICYIVNDMSTRVVGRKRRRWRGGFRV